MFFNVMREKSGRPGRLYDVMMTYWMRFGMRFKISVYSPTQQIYSALHLDIEDAHKVCTIMIHALSHHGELFILFQLLKEVYGVPKPVVLFVDHHQFNSPMDWYSAKDRRLLLPSC